MAKEPEVTLERFNSHSVSTQQSGRTVDKEEAYGYFRTTWQGKPVMVTMEAKRGAHWDWDAPADSEPVWGEWRVFASDCRYIDEEANGRRGDATTPTARTRLADVCRPHVLAWLESADYTTSRQGAFARLIGNVLRDVRPFSDAPTRSVRELLHKYGHELRANAVERLTAACDAYDVFASVLNNDTDD